MTHGGPHAVRAGIAAANDDHVFACGGNEIAVPVTVEQALGIRGEEVHGEVNSLELPAFDGQIARLRGAGAKNDGVEFVQ